MEEDSERMVRMVRMALAQMVDAGDKVSDTMVLWWLMLLSALFEIDFKESLAYQNRTIYVATLIRTWPVTVPVVWIVMRLI